MSLYRRGQTWYADITIPGQSDRFRGTLGTSDKKEAQRLHDELKAKLHQKRRDVKTWYDAVKLWNDHGERSKADKSALVKYDCGDIPLDEITAESFRIGHHKPDTYRRYSNLFKAILRLAHNQGWIARVPEFQKRKTSSGRIRFLTREEWERLYLELPDHIKHLALFSISTGLRQANALNMEWGRIDLDRKVAWIEAKDMKNRTGHGIPLSDSAIEALEAVKGQHKRFCFTYEGERMSTIGEAFGRALKRAEIEDFRWHDLRHTWASWHIMSGTPLEVLQKLGGWKTLSMVLRYAHLAPDHLAKYANNVTTVVHKQVTPP